MSEKRDDSRQDVAVRPFYLGCDRSVTPLLSVLLGILGYTRRTTISAVRGLTTAHLDHRHDAHSNSIGALLAHVAALEVWYQVETFEERTWTPDEAASWAHALELSPRTSTIVAGNSLAFYLETLSGLRQVTERELRIRADEWLLKPTPFGETTANNYWKWFHVCEDELNHRGQIMWLRRRLPGM